MYALSCSVFLVVGFFIGGVTCDWSSDGPSLREGLKAFYTRTMNNSRSIEPHFLLAS